MNWHKPPLYPTSLNSRSEPAGLPRGISSYSESSPPEEINDDVLPVHPLPTSTANQGLPQALPQKNAQGRLVLPHQTNKMSQRLTMPGQPLMQQTITNTYGPAPAIDPDIQALLADGKKNDKNGTLVGIASSGIPSTSVANSQIGKVGTITADRQLGFSRPSLDELRAHVEHILRTLNTYPLNDCHDKVRWFANVVLHQLLDLELYTACSTAVEQCGQIQLKRLQRRLVFLSNEKKKLEQEKKQLTNLRTQLTKEKAELSKSKAELEQTVKTLTPYEAKCQTMKQEEDKFSMDKQNLTKELDEAKKREEELRIRADRMERELDMYKGRQNEQVVMTRQIKQLEEELRAAKSKCMPNGSVTDGTANTEMNETKFRELKQEFKSKKEEVKQLRAELADQKQQRQRCAELEEQLRMSKDNGDKYRHRAMKLDEKLRRKMEKIEEQKVQMAEATSAKLKAEEELDRMREENARLIKEANSAKRGPTASDFGQFNNRIRSITKKKRELDMAIAFIGGQPKRAKCSSVGNDMDNRLGLSRESSASMEKSNANSGQVLDMDTDSLSVVTTVAETNSELTLAEMRNNSCRGNAAPARQQRLVGPDHQQKQPVVKSDVVIAAANDGGQRMETDKDANQQMEHVVVFDALTTEIATCESVQEPLVVSSAASASSAPSRPHDQQPLPSSSSPVVATEQQHCAPSSQPSPITDNEPSGNQQLLVAEQIVTSFIRYISQRPGQNARSLVHEYLQQSAIPLQFRALIAPQLNIIASTSEGARNIL